MARLHEAVRHEQVESPSDARQHAKNKLWERIQRSPHYDQSLGLQRNILKVSNALQKCVENADQTRLHKWRGRMSNDKQAFKWIRRDATPMNPNVRADSEGAPGQTIQGSLGNLQRFWSRIWNRPLVDHTSFWHGYIAHTPGNSAPNRWGSITVDQLKYVQHKSLGSAAGLDGWHADELEAMSDDMWESLISFYHHCESLGRLPSSHPTPMVRLWLIICDLLQLHLHLSGGESCKVPDFAILILNNG